MNCPVCSHRPSEQVPCTFSIKLRSPLRKIKRAQRVADALAASLANVDQILTADKYIKIARTHRTLQCPAGF